MAELKNVFLCEAQWPLLGFSTWASGWGHKVTVRALDGKESISCYFSFPIQATGLK